MAAYRAKEHPPNWVSRYIAMMAVLEGGDSSLPDELEPVRVHIRNCSYCQARCRTQMLLFVNKLDALPDFVILERMAFFGPEQ